MTASSFLVYCKYFLTDTTNFILHNGLSLPETILNILIALWNFYFLKSISDF